MNLPPQQIELAAADGIDIRNYKKRPNADWDQIIGKHKKGRRNETGRPKKRHAL